MFTKVPRLLFLIVAAVLLGAATTGIASADTTAAAQVPTRFRINNLMAVDKCIGINSAGRAGIWYCAPGTTNDQYWRWGGCNESGWCQLVDDFGYCLAVAGGRTDAGAPIVGYDCLTGVADQLWAFRGPAGQERLVNFKATAAHYPQEWIVGVAGANPANGTPLVLWPYGGASNQQWKRW